MSQSSTTGRASEPTPAQMQEFYAQIESGCITKERLQDFLRGQIPTFPSYSVTVDYDQTVEQLVRSRPYYSANGDITSYNFPLWEKGQSQLDIFLLNFNHRISSENAIKAMDVQGLRPATIKELLSLGAQYPDLQKENWIVALGSTWRSPQGGLYVPFLSRCHTNPDLHLSDDWHPEWRFAAVRK